MGEGTVEFQYRYSVRATPDELWGFVSDVPTVGMCIPGASDVKPDPDGSFRGTVKVRVGPVALTLAGKLTVEASDSEARRIVLTGEGADSRVPGSVRVRITLSVEPKDAELTDLVVISEANILGKIGEFGQGIIRRKADGIMKDFGQNLSDKVGRA